MATTPVRFCELDLPTFRKRFPDALADSRDWDLAPSNVDLSQPPENVSYGEVNIIGSGYHPCILDDVTGTPIHFWSEDDGWLDAPIGMPYVRI